ncbi:LAGLIDADG family homing endonuclease [Caldisericum sp.]|uniref:LAGLIDADG family homing endonuclease n=1 Tax=Caldisericum sp. TaxID=2499687 RepID=UPI003D103BD4
MNEKEALFLGSMLGDGYMCISNTRQGLKYFVGVCGNIVEDKEFLLDIIRPVFFNLAGKLPRIEEQPLAGCLRLTVQSKNLLFFMNKEWGLPIGKSRNRKIKNEFTTDPALMKKIVSGFFATDGSLVITNNNNTIYPRIEFQNISYDLLKQIQVFLLTLGLKGGLYKMIRKNPDRIVYRLQYNGKKNLLKFKEEIGFINPKHRLKFDEFKLEMLG